MGSVWLRVHYRVTRREAKGGSEHILEQPGKDTEPVSLTTCSTTVMEVRGCRPPRTTASHVFLISRSWLFSATPGEGDRKLSDSYPIILFCSIQPEGRFPEGAVSQNRMACVLPGERRQGPQLPKGLPVSHPRTNTEERSCPMLLAELTPSEWAHPTVHREIQ